MKLWTICWRDSAEPWGWAPATENAPYDLMPDGPFFWDESQANKVLGQIIERTAERAFEDLRELDRNRHQQDVKRYEKEVARGGPGIGVRIVGQPAPAWKPKEPRPLYSDSKLQEFARREAENAWSIQIYDVPTPLATAVS